MATISNTPRPGYVWDATDNCWYPIGTGPHSHADYITSSSAINPNIVDAKGDIIAATAADTVARLAVGSNDQVLTADSSTATGLKWAAVPTGSLTLLSTTTLSGSTTTISGISGSYTNLFIMAQNINLSNTTAFNLRPNGNSTQNVRVEHSGAASNTYAGSGTAATVVSLTGNSRDCLSGDTDNFWIIEIPDYAATNHRKITRHYGHFKAGSVDWVAVQGASGLYDSDAAITSLVFATGTGTFNGGTIKVYGVK